MATDQSSSGASAQVPLCGQPALPVLEIPAIFAMDPPAFDPIGGLDEIVFQSLDQGMQAAIQSIANGFAREEKEKWEHLCSASKPLYERVVSENFTVDEVVIRLAETSFTPSSEIIIGGSSPHYHGGHVSQAVLKVTPENPSNPIRVLTFEGYSALRSGDIIATKIPRYQIEHFTGLFTRISGDRHPSSHFIFYLDRDFKPEEIAIELTLLSVARKPLRTEQAVNYKEFMK